ncbi:NICN1 [Acanthosepion pharaonis]|uniref:NICN1 n=1 Tax=Acanthosepion pharaonis TaxID=158019 RepID=A0A812CQT5_ACAPH|nr:NICN1 [Sepia pharaonis]
MASPVRKPLICSLQAPLKIGVDKNWANFNSGYKVIQVNFPSLITPEVDEIHFKNNYTALLSIKVKFHEQTEAESGKWKTCLKRYKLMPHPHTETGSQSSFVVNNKQLTCDLNNILALKFILQQPSPVWLDFSITDVKLYKNIRTPYQNNLFSKWMKEEENKNDNPKKLDLDVAAISSTMQQMWALTQQISNVKCDTSLGRYEIDGIYDINLLT